MERVQDGENVMQAVGSDGHGHRARFLIQKRIKELYVEIERLEDLNRALPLQLPASADALLCDLLARFPMKPVDNFF